MANAVLAGALSAEEAVKFFCTVFKQGKPVERKGGSLILASPAEQRRIQLNSANATLEVNLQVRKALLRSHVMLAGNGGNEG